MRALSLAFALLLLPCSVSAQAETAQPETAQTETTQAQTAQAQTAQAETMEAAADEGAPRLGDRPAADEGTAALAAASQPVDAPEDPVAAFFLGLKFWISVAAIVVGVTLAIVVDLTTDDPAPSPDPPMDTSMGLRLRF